MKSKPTLASALVLAGLVLLTVYSPGVQAFAGSTPDDVDSGMRIVADALALIEKNFADPVEPSKALYQGAIPGMLATLDPHSNFLNPAEYADMQRKQRAQYFGVGMLITPEGGNILAYEPFPGSPAAQAGIRRGDILAAIDGKNTKGMDSAKVADLLRGPRGTQVKVTLKREGIPEPFNVVVTRGEITTNNLVDAYWLKPGIAYVGITSFEAQNVGSEVDTQLRRLGEEGVTGLVLDLRGNPGGLVTESVKVAGRFLRDGQVVVSNRGRSAPEQVLRARANSAAQKYPIVVLVDRYSASASEIVSGALQDHDRAWIMGSSTFGKGLVQAQFPLSEGAALLLTIAHYYTPSGRLIQRDYQHRSFWDYYNKRGGGDVQKDVKLTDAGRKVYGGGGIAPDEEYTPPKANIFQARVARSNLVFHFGSVYFGAAQPHLASEAWSPDAEALDRFKKYLRSKDVTFTDEEFEQNRAWVSDRLRMELLLRAFERKTAVRAIIKDDEEVLKAVQSLPKAQALLTMRGPVQRAAVK